MVATCKPSEVCESYFILVLCGKENLGGFLTSIPAFRGVKVICLKLQKLADTLEWLQAIGEYLKEWFSCFVWQGEMGWVFWL